ncbi:MAG: PPC domain-containing protein, partial [Parafilimonas sp.]|nr:PPC domain-containing protein [Parafilimonas sp.]
MKQKILLLLLLASVFFSNAKANESEPNDTRAQANTLPLNGNNSGDINPSADVDWFKVTTTSDGQLNLTLTSTNGINVQAYLYDNDGATLLNNGVTAGTININTDGLAAGTYYIRISTYYTGQTPAYTISNTLTVASVANDAEPDSSRATALTLPLNGTKTGHEGYYYNNQRDLLDFYKITTNGDGLLQLKLTSNNGNNVQAVLYDNNGTTFLGTVVTSTTAYLNVDGLAAGTYYVQVGTYYTNQFAPYTITD